MFDGVCPKFDEKRTFFRNSVLVRNGSNTKSGTLRNFAMKSSFIWFEITQNAKNETVQPLPDEYTFSGITANFVRFRVFTFPILAYSSCPNHCQCFLAERLKSLLRFRDLLITHRITPIKSV